MMLESLEVALAEFLGSKVDEALGVTAQSTMVYFSPGSRDRLLEAERRLGEPIALPISGLYREELSPVPYRHASSNPFVIKDVIVKVDDLDPGAYIKFDVAPVDVRYQFFTYVQSGLDANTLKQYWLFNYADLTELEYTIGADDTVMSIAPVYERPEVADLTEEERQVAGTLYEVSFSFSVRTLLADLPEGSDKIILDAISTYFIDPGATQDIIEIAPDLPPIEPPLPEYALYATGSNNNGQLGLGAGVSEVNTWTRVGSDADWSEITIGSTHTFLLKSDKTIWAIGSNYNYRMGLPILNQRYDVPVDITSTLPGLPTKMQAAQTHSVALINGKIYVIGSNSIGQIGLGSGVSQAAVWTQIGGGSDWIDISSYATSTYAIRSDGTLWATGYNGNYELGLGDNTSRYELTQTGIGEDWKEVYAGRLCFRAITTDGRVFGCGHNSYGALGLGHDTSPVTTLTNGLGIVEPFSVRGSNVAAALISGDTKRLFTAGTALYGTIGSGSGFGESHTFVQRGPDEECIEALVSNQDLYAIFNDKLWVCGRNNIGQLGLGDTTTRYGLVEVPNLDYVKNIAGYDQHALLLKLV